MINKEGKFIVFEGIDGSGKGTQIRKLKEFLEQTGIKTLVTCEHTRDLPIGKLIETTLNGGEKIDPLSLQICFTADRRDHYQKVVGPALERGEFVISDRYYGSTVAYIEDSMKNIMLDFNQNVVPRANLTFFLDVEPEIAMRRIDDGRLTKTIFERIGILENSRKSYLWFCDRLKQEVIVIDGNKEVDIIHLDIIEKLRSRQII